MILVSLRGKHRKHRPRCSSRSIAAVFLAALGSGCGTGPPLYRTPPTTSSDADSRNGGGAAAEDESEPTLDVADVDAQIAEDLARARARADDAAAGLDASEITVRVGLKWDEAWAELQSAEGWSVRQGEEAIRRVSTSDLQAHAEGDAVRLVREGSEIATPSGVAVRLQAANGALATVEGKAYRGEIELVARNDTLFVINQVALEDYLRGVVPAEIGAVPEDAKAAIAAQAVAARTYTIKKVRQYPTLPFDLYASVQDQVYEGASSENPLATIAVRETEGLVLADGSGLVDTYYSSTCGGRRSDIRVVWPERPASPALSGGSDGSTGKEWCRESPHFTWTETWSGQRLAELVRRYGAGEGTIQGKPISGPLTEVVVDRHAASGKIRSIEYRWLGGKLRVVGDRNRWVLRRADSSILRSVDFDLKLERAGGQLTRAIAHGRGNGHGVGLCQWGALGQAKAGKSFREILASYYAGSEVRPLQREDVPGSPGEP